MERQVLTGESEVLEVALRYANAALSVIPIRANGSERPASKFLPKGEDGKSTWRPFQQAIATPDQLRTMFGGNGVGIAIICGWVSGNLDDIGAYRRWYVLMQAQGHKELLDRLVKVGTPRPGVAVLYRVSRSTPIEGNQKLAESTKGDVLIETRDEGGYFIAPGSPAECHPKRRTYEVKRGDICDPPHGAYRPDAGARREAVRDV